MPLRRNLEEQSRGRFLQRADSVSVFELWLFFLNLNLSLDFFVNKHVNFSYLHHQ